MSALKIKGLNHQLPTDRLNASQKNKLNPIGINNSAVHHHAIKQKTEVAKKLTEATNNKTNYLQSLQRANKAAQYTHLLTQLNLTKPLPVKTPNAKNNISLFNRKESTVRDDSFNALNKNKSRFSVVA